METIIDIIKFIWQDDVTFWGLIFILIFCILCWREPDDSKCNEYNRWCG